MGKTVLLDYLAELMAMIRARAAAGSDVDTRLLFSSRCWEYVIYREELERLGGDGLTVVHTLTRSQPPGWTGYSRRVDAEMLADVGPSPAELPGVYVRPDAIGRGRRRGARAARARAAPASRPSASGRREGEKWTH